jgi:ubiquinone/menaquinone biosynthesis C-methylase UbiE
MRQDSPSAAFDPLADDYDAQFSDRAPAKWLRAAVYRHIEPLIEPGSRVLEVGCGTGVDAVWLAERGCRVWATDVSRRMLELAQERAQRSGPAGRIQFHRFDADSPDLQFLAADETVDLVLANFGVMNCVGDLRPFFACLDARLRPGGFVVLAVMGRFCLWETAYFLARGRPRTASRRWGGTASFGNGSARQNIWYHSPSDILAAASGFVETGRFGIGALIPNSEAFGLCERYPTAFRHIARWETRVGEHLPWMSDHFLSVLRKTPA